MAAGKRFKTEQESLFGVKDDDDVEEEEAKGWTLPLFLIFMFWLCGEKVVVQ